MLSDKSQRWDKLTIADGLRVTRSKISCGPMTQRLLTALIVSQETSGGSLVGRLVRGTETTSGWGSAWPARTKVTAEYW